MSGKRQRIKSHFRCVHDFSRRIVGQIRKITAEQRHVEVAVDRRRFDFPDDLIDRLLIIDRPLEGAADGDGDQGGPGGIEFGAQIIGEHLPGGGGGDDPGFEILDVAKFPDRIMRFFGDVENRRERRTCRERFAPEIDAVHVSVGSAVGEHAPVVAAKTEALREKIDRGAFEFIGVEHVPLRFIGIADVDERQIGEAAVEQPAVEPGKIDLLIERIAHLMFAAGDQFMGDLREMLQFFRGGSCRESYGFHFSKIDQVSVKIIH